MGIALFGGGRSYDRQKNNQSYPTDPNPSYFTIQKIWENKKKKMVLAQIKYPNCTNFEGVKLILFSNTTRLNISATLKLDPHFLKTNNVLARFRPNKEGLKLALSILNN